VNPPQVSNQPGAGRSNGLDTLRAAAITLVFMYHYMVFVSGAPTFGPASVVGWAGVDLFFVLSGYLIANQIFSGIACGKQFSSKSFYVRRALRTLPAFWVVLSFYFIFPTIMGGATPPPLWRFLTFTQNWGLHDGTAFSHAWSLCIEEQFYFVLPLTVLLGIWDIRNRTRGWALLTILLAIGIATRTVRWLTDGQTAHIYYSTLGRFDEFLPGVAVAFLKNFHSSLWDRILKRGQSVLAIGAMTTAAMLFAFYHRHFTDNENYMLFLIGLGYSLLAMAFAVLVVAALCPNSWLYRIRIAGAYDIALWSYSIYLSHKAIAFIVKGQIARWELPPYVMSLLIALACVASGALLYRLVELPFMALRARRFPTNFVDRNAPA
jgi:peptidoglycan/LPS O-acetylase OafA/YrhL